MSDTAFQIARTTGRRLRVFRLQNLAGKSFSIFTNESANSTSIYDVVYRLFRLPPWLADDFLLQINCAEQDCQCDEQDDGCDHFPLQDCGEKEDDEEDVDIDTRQKTENPDSPALDLNGPQTTQTSSQRSCAPPQQLLAGDGQSTVGDPLCTDYRFLFPKFQSLQQARARLQTTLVEQEILLSSERNDTSTIAVTERYLGGGCSALPFTARTELAALDLATGSPSCRQAENKDDAKIKALKATYEQACADFYHMEYAQVLCGPTYIGGGLLPECLSKLNRLGLEFCRAFFFVEGVLYEHQDEMLVPSGSAGDEDEDTDNQHSAQAGPHPKNKIPHKNWSMEMARLIGEHHFENVAIACLELADLSVGLRKMLEMQTYSWCEHLPELYLQLLKQRSHTARVAISSPSWCLPDTVPSSSTSLLQLRQSLPPASVVTSHGFHIAPVLQPEGATPGFHFHPVLRSARTGLKADGQDLDHASDVKTTAGALVFTKTGLLSLCPPLVTSFVADDDVLKGSGNSDAKKLHVVWNDIPDEVSRDIQLHVRQLLEVEEIAAGAAGAGKAVDGRGGDSSQGHQLQHQLLWETLYDPDITPLALFLEVVTDEEAVLGWQFEDAVFEQHDEKAENENSAKSKSEGIVDQRTGRGNGTRTSWGKIVDESNMIAAARSAPAQSVQERDKTEVSANAVAADDVEKLFLSVPGASCDVEITARNSTRSTDRDEVDHTSLLSSSSLNAAERLGPSALGIAIDQHVVLSKPDHVRVRSDLQKVLFSDARMRTVTEETSLDIFRNKNRVQDDIKTNGGGSWISGKRRAILGDRRRTCLKIIETLVAERSDLDLALHLDFPMTYHPGFFPMCTVGEFLRDEVFSSGKFAELRSVLERCPRFMSEFVTIHRSSDTCAPSAAASSSVSIDGDAASSTSSCLHQVQCGKPRYECSVRVGGAGVLNLEAVDVALQESLETTARSSLEGGGCDVN
eukprot:CAMPEP_0179007452 /NCGR_PEP_ID=MMETSP0795-20121207/15168_1 /TAXON_ID=88552 /ORGANISM="Amoebophrya sp., Strain Ameob2" /LENGTH=969 /DNA_ID=CAMNT_0020702427 /DNA_START=189 /DNA_END=3098 /DNA_ORIENTATION=+